MSASFTYDPLSPAMIHDPYPVYAHMLDEVPIHWHEKMQSWVVVRHADCVRVLRESKTFARDPRRIGEEVPQFRQNVQMLDPPEQAPLRRMLVSAMRSQAREEQFAAATAVMRTLLASQRPGEPFDWMAQASAPFALHLSALLMGVPLPDDAEYADISHGVALRMDAGLAPENIPVGDAARERLNALGESWFPRPEGDEGLVARLVERADADFAAGHLIRNSAAMMFNASYGTLFAMAGNAALLLATRPELLRDLADSALLATGVDELVRFDGPAQGTSRIAAVDTSIAGVDVTRGQSVVTLMAAANRDPRIFEEPDLIRLDRRPNPHLGFGSGPHACFGSEFGRLGISAMITALLEDGRKPRLAAAPTRRATATVRSADVLPLILE